MVSNHLWSNWQLTYSLRGLFSKMHQSSIIQSPGHTPSGDGRCLLHTVIVRNLWKREHRVWYSTPWLQINGKQKAYVVNQDTLETPEGENIEEMDALIRTKTAELNQLKEEQKAAEGSLRSWTSKLRDVTNWILIFDIWYFLERTRRHYFLTRILAAKLFTN